MQRIKLEKATREYRCHNCGHLVNVGRMPVLCPHCDEQVPKTQAARA